MRPLFIALLAVTVWGCGSARAETFKIPLALGPVALPDVISSSFFTIPHNPMQRYKKRLRLLTVKLGGTMNHGADDSLITRFESHTVKFASTTYDMMSCSIDLGDGPRTTAISKKYAFDIVDRLSKSHLLDSLHEYPKPPILRINDYIDGECGTAELKSLREKIGKDSSLTHVSLGGNRILVEYYHGVLILRDDLAMLGTNVIEF